jgi:hypothetical protein
MWVLHVLNALVGVSSLVLLSMLASWSPAMAFVPLCALFAFYAIQAPNCQYAAARLVLAYISLVDVAIWEPIQRVVRHVQPTLKALLFRPTAVETVAAVHMLINDIDGTNNNGALVPRALYIQCLCYNDAGENEHVSMLNDPAAPCPYGNSRCLRVISYSVPHFDRTDYADEFLCFWEHPDISSSLAGPIFYSKSHWNFNIQGFQALKRHKIESAEVHLVEDGGSVESWVDVTSSVRSMAGPLCDFHTEMPLGVVRTQIIDKNYPSQLFKALLDLEPQREVEEATLRVRVNSILNQDGTEVRVKLKSADFSIAALHKEIQDAVLIEAK